MDVQGNVRANLAQCLPYAVAGNTAADRIDFGGELEQFAADLLTRNGPEVLPHFLALYRKDYNVLLSEDVTEMLGSAIGPNGTRWLDELTYF